MSNERRVYSLNLASYIMLTTGNVPVLKTEDNKIYYCVFPQTDEVKQAVIDFKNPELRIKIHEYLNQYKIIKTMIYELRGDVVNEKT